MDFVRETTNFIETYYMLDEVTDIVIGVSGGADSTALLLVMDEIRKTGKYTYDIHAVHINHMIRGAEADRDEGFVKKLADALGIHCTVYRKDIPNMARELSLTEEEAGRMFRYECFENEALKCMDQDPPEDVKSSYRVRIAVAHNRDDLAETVLMNAVRGSSIRGIGGIRPTRGRIIRPLLMTWRKDIEAYLADKGQTYVTDSTNLELDYTRNNIRNVIMPALTGINQGAAEHLTSLAEDAWKLYEGIDSAVDSFIKESAVIKYQKSSDEESPVRADININALRKLDVFTRREIALELIGRMAGRRKDITRQHVDSFLGLMELSSGAMVNLPYGLTGRRNYDDLVIDKVTDSETENGTFSTTKIVWTSDSVVSKEEYTKMVDCDKIDGTPVLRFPEDGDYIIINESGDCKKLSRLFTDLKIDRTKRDRIPVVAVGDTHEIIWVIGYRLSESVKIDNNTKDVLILSYQRTEEEAQ